MAKRGRRKADKTDAGPAPAGHNEFTDEELQALFFQHKSLFETRLAAKKKADADFKNACKLIKSEGGKTQVADIKTAIRLDTDEGEADVKSELENTLRVARWMGASIGSQFEMFDEDRTPAVDRAFDEGKRAGMKGEPRKPPHDPSTPQYATWMEGYGVGNEALATKGFKAPATAPEAEGEPPKGMSKKDWHEQLRRQHEEGLNLGTAEPTHQVVS